MSEIPLTDPEIGSEAYDRVHAVLESGHLADGPEVRAFENEFASYCRSEHAVATSNGTTALVAALRSLGIGDGDAVVTSAFSFVASANAVRLAGATPVFADIDPDTYTIDPHAVEEIVKKRNDVAGIVPVHLYGLPADMNALVDLADEHDLAVVEDACQAHGAAIDRQRVGSFGDAGCFSFYPTKNMTTGEGGVITTDRADVAERAASYINHGRDVSDERRGYEHVRLGHNHRMTSLAGAIGRTQLDRLPDFTDARRENARFYDERLTGLPVETPTVPRNYRHVYHQYTLRVDDRDGLADALEERGIGAGVYYPTPIHNLPAYETISTAAADLPRSERAAERVLSIPVHPNITEDDRNAVVEAIADHLEEN